MADVSPEMIEAAMTKFRGRAALSHWYTALSDSQLAACLTAALTASPVGWPEARPISEAPKDGTRILAWPCILDDGPVAVVAWWYVHPSISGWLTDAIDCNDYEFEPTLFWDLPPAPEAGGRT